MGKYSLPIMSKINWNRPKFVFDAPVYHYKIWLTVPFAEKDEAKELGAMWDPKMKLWFITSSVNRVKFKQWLRRDRKIS